MLKATNLYRKVYEHLKEEIRQGTFASEEVVFETQLAERLGVSRTPVREAMRMLEHEGLIEQLSGGGFRAHAITPRDIRDASRTRLVLESLTVRLACERRQGEHIDSLETCLRDTERAIANGLLGDVMAQNEMFHRLIARATGSRLLELLVERVYDYMKGHRLLQALAARGDIGAVVPGILQQHRDIFGAIRANDPERAALLMDRHLREVGQRYEASLALSEESDRDVTNV